MSKYQLWYDSIILRARTRTLDCYKETHHVLPRSLGGDDHPSNLVDLTYREHFLVHWLLTYIHQGDKRRKMLWALRAMTLPVSGERIIAAWQFETAKRLYFEPIKKRIAIRKAIQKADENARNKRGDAATMFLRHQ